MSQKMLKFTDIDQQSPTKREVSIRKDDFCEIFNQFFANLFISFLIDLSVIIFLLLFLFLLKLIIAPFSNDLVMNLCPS